jgi:organic hydroperoxide reductase OsmC/OhrA
LYDILCSVPAEFGGDEQRYNPEELLLASLATCHMLVYLLTEAVLRPRVVVSEAAMVPAANALHGKVNAICVIANACRFPVHHEPTAEVSGA